MGGAGGVSAQLPSPAIPSQKKPRRSLGLAVGLSNLAAGRSVVVETVKEEMGGEGGVGEST